MRASRSLFVQAGADVPALPCISACLHDARASVRHTGVHTQQRAWWSVLVGAARRDRRARPRASIVGAAYYILMGRSEFELFAYPTPGTHYMRSWELEAKIHFV